MILSTEAFRYVLNGKEKNQNLKLKKRIQSELPGQRVLE